MIIYENRGGIYNDLLVEPRSNDKNECKEIP